MDFISFFAGIGGFDLGLERAGHTCVGQCEIDPFALRVLAKHWPNVPRFGDIMELRPDEIPDAELWCGGFPCQDVSSAGKQAGIRGERSGLFFNFMRLAAKVRPRFLLLENVEALLIRGMGEVLGTLAKCGYDAEWDVLRASRFGAAHRRKRVFIIAYAKSVRLPGRVFSCALPEQLPRVGDTPYRFTVTEPIGIGTNHGIPDYVDRVTALGNAIVPVVAEYLGELLAGVESSCQLPVANCQRSCND